MRWIGYLLGTLALLLVAPVLVVAFMPTGWIVERAERFAAEKYGLELDIGSLDLNVLTLTPGASVAAVSLGDGEGGEIVSGADARVAVDLRPLFGGELVFDEITLSDADIAIAIDEDGRGNWEDLVPATDDGTAPPDDAPIGIPAIRTLAIENVHVDLADARLGQTLALDIAASGSTTDTSRPTVLAADGTLDDLPLDVDVTLAPLDTLADSLGASGSAEGEADLTLDATALVGDSRIAVNGTIGEPATLGRPELELAFSAPDGEDVAALASLAGIELPTLPEMAFTSDLRRDGDEYVVSRFDARLGENALEGDVRIDPTAAPPTLYANLISPRLDLDALSAILDGGETVTERAAGDGAEAVAGPLLSDAPLDLAPLAAAFDGAIRLRIEDIVSSGPPLDSLDLRLENAGDTLTLTPEIGLADGEITGAVDFDTAATPPGGTVELAARGVELGRVVAALGVDDESFGKLGGRLKAWIEGDSVASLAASADGGLYVAMTGGELDALLVELSAIDVAESLVDLVDPGKETTAVDCGYADLQSEDGVIDIASFVLESADTIYIADGTIDLGAESLDVTLEPHPRDPSLLSATTSVNVSGTLGDLSVVPGGQLGARAAIAATLAAVAAPAAALFAFVDTGGGEDSPYCGGLADALPDSR